MPVTNDSITHEDYIENKGFDFHHTLNDNQFARIDVRVIEGMNIEEQHSADILAYYVPLHFDNPRNSRQRWGIHFLEWGINYLSEKLRRISINNGFELPIRECCVLAKEKINST